jgi:hypothetical protein
VLLVVSVHPIKIPRERERERERENFHCFCIKSTLTFIAEDPSNLCKREAQTLTLTSSRDGGRRAREREKKKGGEETHEIDGSEICIAILQRLLAISALERS